MEFPSEILRAVRLTVGGIALFLGSCADAQQEVAGHRYQVPKANLVPLPKSDTGGFLFILNPEAELRQQRSVLVEDRETVCERANGQGYVSRTVCGSRSVEWRERGWRKTGDETFWTYSPNTPSSPDAPFVSCHKMQIEGHPGLCKASLACGKLLLTISLKGDELIALEVTYERAVSMLRSWEA